MNATQGQAVSELLARAGAPAHEVSYAPSAPYARDGGRSLVPIPLTRGTAIVDAHTATVTFQGRVVRVVVVAPSGATRTAVARSTRETIGWWTAVTRDAVRSIRRPLVHR